MQTPEERIDALCENIGNKLKDSLDQLDAFNKIFFVRDTTSRINNEANAGNLKDEIIRRIARRCGYEPYGK